MLKRLGFRLLAILSLALGAPAFLLGGANVWTSSRPGRASISGQTLVASCLGLPDLVYAAEGPDLFRSADGGRTWKLAASFEQIFSLYVDPGGAVFLGALRQGSSGIFKSVDGGASWKQTLRGSFHVFIQRFAGSLSTFYASSYDSIYRSDDGGETWAAVKPPAGKDSHLTQSIAALVIKPADQAPYAGGYDYDYFGYGYSYSPVGPFLRKSTDQGASWTDVEGRLNAPTVTAIAFDPVDPSVLYAGSGTVLHRIGPINSLFRSADGGASWVLAESGLPPHASISGLVVDPLDRHSLYAATDSGIYRTRDSGASWFPLGQFLNGNAVGSLTLDSSAHGASGRVLRVGSIYGVFQFEIGAGALDIAAGAGRSHVLSWDADRLTVRTLDDSGLESRTSPEGPSNSWLATAISDGADGLSRVLWVSGEGRAAVEIVSSGGRQAVFLFPAVMNWSPVDVSVGADGTANLLWTNQTGAMYLSRVDASGNATLGPTYGPYSSWTPLALADSPDGSTWVLWRSADGRSSVSVHRNLVMEGVFRFDAIPGWASEDITVGADGRPRLLRVGANGSSEVSTIDAQGRLTNANVHAPEWLPRRIAAGPDGLTRLLFSDPGGGAGVLLLKPDNTQVTDEDP